MTPIPETAAEFLRERANWLRVERQAATARRESFGTWVARDFTGTSRSPGRRLRGVRLLATDTDWSAGAGVELRGPIRILCCW